MSETTDDDEKYSDGQDVVYSAERLVTGGSYAGKTAGSAGSETTFGSAFGATSGSGGSHSGSRGSGGSHSSSGGSGGSHSGSGKVPCFASGTLIETSTGPVAIEDIREGAKIVTRDQGLQPVLWAGAQSYSSAQIARSTGLQPIVVAAHSFAPNTPSQPLFLSPQHRVLLQGAGISLHFGVDEALANIGALTNGQSVANDRRARPLTYHHLLFARHQIILANDLWCESFFPGDMALSAIQPQARVEIAAVLGPALHRMRTARLCLKPFEARLVADQIIMPHAKGAKAA